MHTLIWIPYSDIPPIPFEYHPLINWIHENQFSFEAIGVGANTVPVLIRLGRLGAESITVVDGHMSLSAVLARLPDVKLVLTIHPISDLEICGLPRVRALRVTDDGQIEAVQRVPSGRRWVRCTPPSVLHVSLDMSTRAPNAMSHKPPKLNTWTGTAHTEPTHTLRDMTSSPDEAAAALVALFRERGLYDAPYPLPPRAEKFDAVPAMEMPLLHSAPMVLGYGRGLVYSETYPTIGDPQLFYREAQARYTQLMALSKALHAPIATTRFMVDAAGIPAVHLIGQSGKRISPDIYLAWGIGGASQHMHGVHEHTTVIAVNTDPHAPIFERADIALYQDAHALLVALHHHLSQVVANDG